VPKLSGIPHLRAVRALEKAGFTVVREGSRHIVMSKGGAFVTIPRHDPVNAYTMGGIIRDAGLTVEEFRKLL
jgi:predicted RNA binding protein YcfA (HicA-like mRNA interferase family)